MRNEPWEKLLRDIRIFPIFEGANDVMRSFIALSGMKPLGEELSELGDIGLGDPIGSIGVLAGALFDRLERRVRPDRVTRAPGGLQGRVVDFIHFHFWPTFNLADSAIVIGVGLLILHELRPRPRSPVAS